MRSSELGVLADVAQVGRGVATQTRLEGRPSGRATLRPWADGQPQAGPHQRVTTEQDRDRARRLPPPSARAATDRRSARGAGGRRRTGPRAPASAARRRPSRWASSTRVSMMAASARRARVAPSAGRAVPVEQQRRATDAGGPLAGDDRAQAAFLDERPGSRGGPPLQPAQRGRRRPSGDEQLRLGVGGDRADRRRVAPRRGRAVASPIGRAHAPAEQHEVERAVDVDAEPPAPPQVRDRARRPTRPASAAGHCRRRGPAGPGAPRPLARSRRCRPSIGRSRAPPVARPRRPRRRRGGRRPSRAGWRPSPARRARRSPASAASSSEPAAERCIVGRPRHDPRARRAGREEADAVPLGEGSPGCRDRGLERTRRGACLWVQDEHADVVGGHAGRV